MDKARFEFVSQKEWEHSKKFLQSSSGTFSGMASYGELILPKRSTAYSAGYDIFSTVSFTLHSYDEITFPLGFKMYIPPGWFFMIVPRSGLGFSFYSRLANTVGIIDGDYYDNPGNEGHVGCKLRCEDDTSMHISKGQRILQGILLPFGLVEGDSIGTGDARTGGYGSTG